MSAIDVQDALVNHLLQMPGLWDYVLPGESVEVARPRLVIARGASRQQVLGGTGMTQVDAEIMVRVEDLSNRYTTSADAQIRAIVAHFPLGLSLGSVDIEAAPSVMPPLDMDSAYATPVLISGRGYF